MAEVALSNGEKTLKVPNHAEELEGRTLTQNGEEAKENEPPAEAEEDKKTDGKRTNYLEGWLRILTLEKESDESDSDESINIEINPIVGPTSITLVGII